LYLCSWDEVVQEKTITPEILPEEVILNPDYTYIS
jgi:hypothetical protein